MHLTELIQGFESCTLPKDAWTHAAHLRAGTWYVRHLGQDAALETLRRRIRAFNESVGGQNTESAGYHESLTRFYVHMIAWHVTSASPDLADEKLATQVAAALDDRDIPLLHWSRACLFSPAARLGWVAPDRLPLP